jgi:hypothetical protein
MDDRASRPIRALDKHLRDGRHLTIDLIPRHDGGYWMHALLDGEVTADRFLTKPERNSSPVPGLPHTITVQFTEHNPETGWNRLVRRPVGLTEAEADGIDAAIREWRERPGRLAREAAPQAPTWQIRGLTYPVSAGTVLEGVGPVPVMVLSYDERWIEEDGRSFNLDAEEGCLYDATVRALTDQERAEQAEKNERDTLVSRAYAAAVESTAAGLFGWSGGIHEDEVPADAVRVEGAPDGKTLHLGRACILVMTEDAIYARTIAGSVITDSTYRHPLTPKRTKVFKTLYAASDRGHLHIP